MRKLYWNDTEIVYVISGFYGYARECVPASFFQPFVLMDFEDRKYAAVKEKDKMLVQLKKALNKRVA